MELVLYPDPVLRKRAEPVPSVDASLRERAEEMLRIMYRENGVGLAAPQVGWSARLFVMNAYGPDRPECAQVLVNPRLTALDGSDVDEEGCLSIPDVRGKVERADRVEVEALNLDGEAIRVCYAGLPARIVQHEYDHLDGILFISRLSMSEKLGVKKALRKLEKDFKQRAGSSSGRR